MGKIMYNGEPYSGSFDKSINVSYDNTNSGLDAINVQNAIDEVVSDLSMLDMKVYSELPEDTDFNDITTAGMYTVNSGTNSPSGTKTYFTVLVMPFNNNPDYLSQIAVYMGDYNLYHRRKNNGNWGDWMRYAREEEVTALRAKIPTIQSGTYSFTLAGGASSESTYIPFPTAYTDVPMISLSKTVYGIYLELYNVSVNKYGITLFAKNTATNEITLKFLWQAIGFTS